MTSLGVPSQGATLAAGAAASNALASGGGGKRQAAHDSSVFVALLGALDDASAQAHPANGNSPPTAPPSTPAADETSPAAAPPSSPVSAVHSLGSGVLVALDKRFAAPATEKKDPPAPETPKTGADNNADMSALTSVGWAALIMSATGAAPALVSSAPVKGASGTPPAGQAKAAAIGAASAALVVKTEAGAAGAAPAAQPDKAAAGASVAAQVDNAATGAIADDAKIQVQLPSDAKVTNALQPIALTAGTAPVDVKVVRSITYLGLDPTVRDAGVGPAAASASPRASATASRAPESPHAGPEQNKPNMALAPLANAGGGSSSTMSGNEQPKPHMPDASNGERVSAAAKASSPDIAASPGAAPVSAPDAVQINLGAISASDIPSVQIGQLANVIANAAQSLAPQSANPAPSVRTAVATSPASMAPVKELDVQLNPASLGALTIEMRLSNGNLSVTIKADKSDTLKLIENERSSISEKLKSLNFSVESLTVKALDTAAPSGARGDASNSGTTGYGEAQHGQSGQTADGSPNNGRSLQGDGEQEKPRPRERGVPGEPGDDRILGHRFV